MNDFKAIYKILRTLQKWRGRENFEPEFISAKRLKMKYEDWEQLMIELQEGGYIKGLVYTKTLTDKWPHIAEPIEPRITLDGIAFLENNSNVQKAKEALKLIGDIIP